MTTPTAEAAAAAAQTASDAVAAAATDAAAKSAATAAAAKPEIVLDFLPQKPSPLDETAASLLSDPTLESLGLASWWPSGRFQYILETLHVSLDIPWWGCIMICELQ